MEEPRTDRDGPWFDRPTRNRRTLRHYPPIRSIAHAGGEVKRIACFIAAMSRSWTDASGVQGHVITFVQIRSSGSVSPGPRAAGYTAYTRATGSNPTATVWAAAAANGDQSLTWLLTATALSSDPQSRAITAIQVTHHGTDPGEDAPLRRQVEQRSGQKVQEHRLDGGYVTRDGIEQAAQEQVAVYGPPPPGPLRA